MKNRLIITEDMIDYYDHMNHMEYIKLFEEEQRKYLERLSAEFTLLENEGLKVVQRHFSIDYLYPLFDSDSIEVNTLVIELGKSSFVFEQNILVGNKKASTAKTVYVVSDGRGSKKIIPQWYKDKIR